MDVMRDTQHGLHESDLGFGIEQWVRVREAARVASVDPRTIRRWADSGRIRARLTAGGHRQISLDGLRDAYSAAKRSANPDPVGISPDAAVPSWAATSSLWHSWRPSRRLSDDDLVGIRLDLNRLTDAIADLEVVITDELRERDRRAVEGAAEGRSYEYGT